MSTEQPPIANQATILREEYMAAHETAMRRAMIFENGQRQIEYVNQLLMTITFYMASSPAAVQELFEKHIESNVDSVQILDYLHDFMSEFTFRMLSHDVRLPKTVLNMTVESISVNHPDARATALPSHYVDGMVKRGEIGEVFSGNAWYYALALMRMFGGYLLSDVSHLSRKQQQQAPK